MSDGSRAKEIEQYSFLYALANDDVISESELSFMKKLALKDGVIDEEEKRVLCSLLDRVNEDHVDDQLKKSLHDFSKELGC
ncbi:MAG: hypothetical protein MI867_04845 [Pseudomonadales bacterium]|nr:hypothetical protein [Pseudomonadales bacterium]